MIRIGIDVRDLKIAKTGVRTWLQEMIRAWEQDPQIELIQLDNQRSVYTGSNPLFKIIEHLRFYFWKEIQLPVLANRKKCDWVVCSDYISPILKLKFNTLLILHDAFFWEYPSHYNKLWLWLFKTIGGWGIQRADLIVTPSAYSKKAILKFIHKPETDLNVVYEAARKFPEPSQASPIKKPYLLHIGVLEKRKNLPALVRAFKRIADQFPQHQLILAGNTPRKLTINDEPQIRRAIKECGLEDRVQLLGHVSDQQASNLYAHADAYVFPSFNEGFGLPVLEAFQFGIPVAVANNSTLPEIGGDAVLKFDPFDIENIASALSEILSNQEMRNELVKKGKQRVAAFSWESSAQQIRDLIIAHK